MNVHGKPMTTIWTEAGYPNSVRIIDQRYLPHELIIKSLHTPEETAEAIKEMWVRGAPLIGVCAAYGLWLATLVKTDDEYLISQAEKLKSTRPTAINLMWAVDKTIKHLLSISESERPAAALDFAQSLTRKDIQTCKNIGLMGLPVLRKIYEKTNKTVQILTHCNAGWLGCVDYGTATAPLYMAHDEGIPIHVWVDETRPRNQGANLTAWELGQHGIPHHVITDNAGGLLMQQGKVDMCIVGTDRTTYTGDVANKIGTYLKALAAADNGIPFYVALPSSTIDWQISDGIKDIPIEERNEDEVHYVYGKDGDIWGKVRVTPAASSASNYGFDITPARLVTGGLITERGICTADEAGIRLLFPEM